VLAEQRAVIDRLNRELLALLEARGRAVELIMKLKKESGFAISDPGREERMLAGLRAAVQGPYTPEQIERVYRCIFEISRELGEHQRYRAQSR